MSAALEQSPPPAAVVFLRGVCFACAVTLALAAGFLQTASAAEVFKPVEAESPSAPAPLSPGREAGDYVPTFYSRAVSGPLMNKSLCYVCKNGMRPVVMVLLRDVKRDHRPLLKNIDRLVDLHRAGGIRGFGVLISENPFGSISRVQSFAHNHTIGMPLTVAPPSVANESVQNVPEEAEVTVVMYRRRRVVKAYSFRAGELDYEQSRDLIRSVREFIDENAAPTSADEESVGGG